MQTIENIYVGGEFIAPSGSGTIDVISPHTEQVIARVPDGTKEDIDKAVAAARKAFDTGPWPQLTPQERAGYITALSQLIQSRMDDWAGVISQEMGSPFSFSQMGQIFASTMVLDFYAGLADTYHFEEVRNGVMGPALVRREPIGVAAAIVPWNVPLFTTVLKLGPALLAGCTVVIKPAPETPLDAYLLAEALRGDRPAQGRHQHRRRRPRGQRAPGHPPRRRQDRLHRLDRCRQEDRRPRGRAAQAGHPRARRQVGLDLPARR